MKFISVVVTGLFFVAFTWGQRSGSPYSSFDIGDIKSKGTAEYQQMQGISVFADSVEINIQNPAALSKLRLTNFSAGATYDKLSLYIDRNSETSQEATVDYFAFGFPVSKRMGVAFGLQPQSTASYKLYANKTVSLANKQNNPNVLGKQLSLNQFWQGSGGMYNFFIASGLRIKKNIGLGVSLDYNFGTIERYLATIIKGYEFASSQTKTSELKGVEFGFSVIYAPLIKNKWRLHTSLVYKPQSQVIASNNALNSVGILTSIDGGLNSQTGESVIENLASTNRVQTIITTPNKIVTGIGIGKDNKWMAAFQFKYREKYKYSNRFFNSGASNSSTRDSYNLAFGGFYIPNFNSYSNYLKRMVYRGGISFQDEGIVLDVGTSNKNITTFGASLGVAFPLSGFSKISIGLEYRKRGEKDLGVILEESFSIRLGLSLADRWFIKRKYN